MIFLMYKKVTHYLGVFCEERRLIIGDKKNCLPTEGWYQEAA